MAMTFPLSSCQIDVKIDRNFQFIGTVQGKNYYKRYYANCLTLVLGIFFKVIIRQWVAIYTIRQKYVILKMILV